MDNVRVYRLILCATNPEGGRWRFGWWHELFEWENELLSSLLVRLEGVGVDSWVWKPDNGRGFFC